MNLFDATLIGSIESAINGYLDTRANARQKLSALAGQSLTVCLLPQSWHFTFVFASDHISVLQNYEGEPTAKITGTAIDLTRVMSTPNEVMFGQGVSVEGDSALLQRLNQALSDPQLDWEAWLAGHLGGMPAAFLSQQSSQVMAWLSDNRSRVQETAKEYLQEEINLLPSRIEYEGFVYDTAQAKSKLELLERRITALLQND